MNRHQFQQAAKKFRAGEITLEDFTQQVMPREGAGSKTLSKSSIGLPKREAESHKGDFGRVLVIGGSRGMAGAPTLSGFAALRGGAGLVTVAAPQDCFPMVAAFNPCVMTVELPSENGKIADGYSELSKLIDQSDVVAIGPGLGQSAALSSLLTRLYLEVERPIVFDADALNGLAQLFLTVEKLEVPAGPRILTPHPGEFLRMTDKKYKDREAMCEAARLFAGKTNSIVVLKGHETLITEGNRQRINATGNSGMATAGSGDVLTGIVAALVAQKMSCFEAAITACHLHGLAGDLAAKELGQRSLVATDLIDFLPMAFKSVENERSTP